MNVLAHRCSTSVQTLSSAGGIQPIGSCPVRCYVCRSAKMSQRCLQSSRRATNDHHPSSGKSFSITVAPTVYSDILGTRHWATWYQMVELPRTGCESQLHHLPTGSPWASGCSSLSFSFFQFEMAAVIHPTPWGWCWNTIWPKLRTEYNGWHFLRNIANSQKTIIISLNPTW